MGLELDDPEVVSNPNHIMILCVNMCFWFFITQLSQRKACINSWVRNEWTGKIIKPEYFMHLYKIQLTEVYSINTKKMPRTANSLNKKYFTFFLRKSCIQLLGAQRWHRHHNPVSRWWEDLNSWAPPPLDDAKQGIGGGMPPTLEKVAKNTDCRTPPGWALHDWPAAATGWLLRMPR